MALPFDIVRTSKSDKTAQVFIDWLLTESSPDTYHESKCVQMYRSSEDSRRVPRWVKLFAVVLAALLAVFAFMHVANERFQHGSTATKASEAGQ